MNTLWIVGAGTETVPGIQRAKELGLWVVASDGNPNAPGFAYADDRVVVSTYDTVHTAEAAHRYSQTHRKIDGVISIAVDVPLTVATVAAELELPSISLETAQLAIDKFRMKQRFVDHGVPTSWFSRVESLTHLEHLVNQQGTQLVLKPIDSRGARGVLQLSKVEDLRWAYQYALENSPGQQLMVEEYLSGPQISTESIFINGQAATPGFSDRNYEWLERFAPYVIENGGELPSRLSVHDRQAVTAVAEQAARALGVVTGVAKGDMVLTDDGPKVIEIAPRFSGGWFCTDQIPMATGVDIVGIGIRLALGESVSFDELQPRHTRGVAVRYFFPAPGRVVALKNVEHVQKMPGLYRIGFFVAPGDVIDSVTNHTKRAGFVITTGESREEARDRALDAVEIVEIETVPV